jgi:hypothetical protein
MKPSSVCFRIGGTAWILLAGIAGLSYLGHQTINYGIQPSVWPVLGILLGGGGLISVMVGAILSLWQR